jgi:VanZ family protein
MGLLSGVVCWAFADARLAGVRLGVLGVTLLLGIAVGLEELSQGWIPGRTVSLTDLLAGYLGIVIAAALVAGLRGLSSRARSRARGGV